MQNERRTTYSWEGPLPNDFRVYAIAMIQRCAAHTSGVPFSGVPLTPAVCHRHDRLHKRCRYFTKSDAASHQKAAQPKDFRVYVKMPTCRTSGTPLTVEKTLYRMISESMHEWRQSKCCQVLNTLFSRLEIMFWICLLYILKHRKPAVLNM